MQFQQRAVPLFAERRQVMMMGAQFEGCRGISEWLRFCPIKVVKKIAVRRQCLTGCRYILGRHQQVDIHLLAKADG